MTTGVSTHRAHGGAQEGEGDRFLGDSYVSHARVPECEGCGGSGLDDSNASTKDGVRHRVCGPCMVCQGAGMLTRESGRLHPNQDPFQENTSRANGLRVGW
jgi:hypothetical protein